MDDFENVCRFHFRNFYHYYKLHLMKFIFIFLPAFFMMACNSDQKKTGTENVQQKDSVPSGKQQANGTALVKISKGGKQVAEYTPSMPAAATFPKSSGHESMMIKLNSADNVYSLMGTLNTPASGNYKLDVEGKSDAQFQFLSDGSTKLPTMLNLKGSLQITLTGETCSGTFSGTDKVMNESYEVSGSFTNIPLEKR